MKAHVVFTTREPVLIVTRQTSSPSFRQTSEPVIHSGVG